MPQQRKPNDLLLAGLRDPARRIDPTAVCIEQQRNHHGRMVRRVRTHVGGAYRMRTAYQRYVSQQALNRRVAHD
jgi:hypothetical protein